MAGSCVVQTLETSLLEGLLASHGLEMTAFCADPLTNPRPITGNSGRTGLQRPGQRDHLAGKIEQ